MMRRVLSWLLAWAIAGTSLMLARNARADEEPVVVVDVKEAASELDADKLRVLIAKELHARIVKPVDPRARSARGIVTVDVDRESGELSVSYLAQTTPTTRHVPLPGDAASARNAAVLLAGNLARDEASELAAELRKRAPAAPSDAPTRKPDGDRAISLVRLGRRREAREALGPFADGKYGGYREAEAAELLDALVTADGGLQTP